MSLKAYWRVVLLHLGIAWYLFAVIVARCLWWCSPSLGARWCLFSGLYEACRQLVLDEQLAGSLSKDR